MPLPLLIDPASQFPLKPMRAIKHTSP